MTALMQLDIALHPSADTPVEFFSTFTPAYDVNYFRQLADLSAEGRSDPEENLLLMLRYATVPC
jgi:hypothetical protein